MAREMKDSGVEWIGEIPENWILSRLKYEADFEPKCNFSKVSNDSMITYTPMEYIKNGYYIPNEAPYEKVSLSLTPYEENDIVMAKVTPCFENGNIAIMNGLPSGIGMGSSELFVFRAKSMLTKYLFYWLQNKAFMDRAKSTMTGTGGLKRVSSSFVRNCEIHKPPYEEQKRIADFLDNECARIDAVIEQTRASIEEYKKLKQAVITQTVTKGIRPNRLMKDSGINIYGVIPKSWDCCKLKYLISSLNSGTSVLATDLIEDGYPVFGGGQQIGCYSHFNMENTLVIGRVGARCGCVTKVEGKAWATDNALIVSTAFPTNYLYYILVAAELNKLNTSNAQPLITSGKVLNHKVPICWDKVEQYEITAYLDEKTFEIDKLIEKKELFISELEKHKKSLIYEYVTGKKEVPA